ncbi:hypothetical protein G7054_g9941 [Neopestalotiopsis clavispora]|nr:hypothetical protein G7054_g9941 [Neopestalotiopsis clavispora]
MASLQYSEPAGNIRATELSATTSTGLSSSIGFLNNNRRHSSTQNISSPALQNNRVAQIIQATGHKTTTSAFSNRFNSPAQNQQQSPQQQLFASFPANVALNSSQQNRPARPPVPLFTQSHNQSGKMDLQGNSYSIMASRDFSSHPIDALNSFEDYAALEAGSSGSGFSSPAPAYDMHSAASSTTNIGTVSPHDLMLQESFSAPNSAAFTNLTSPSLYEESPEFNEMDLSPHFGDADFTTNLNDWYPLFPEASAIKDQQTQVPAILDNSPTLSEDLDVIEPTSQPEPRRKSATSPSAGHGRHSSVSGVNARRRDKPLPPIIVDNPDDSTAMKRARNTLAARKSRERKAQRLDDLEAEIKKLEAERDHWKRIALSSRSGSS